MLNNKVLVGCYAIFLFSSLSLAQSVNGITNQSISGPWTNPVNLSNQPMEIELPNAAAGTIVGSLVKKVDTAGTLQITKTAITDTNNALGCVQSGSGTSGTAQIAVLGTASCLFDNTALTDGDFIVVSTAVAGTMNDAGTSFPTGALNLGVVKGSHASCGSPPCGPWTILLMTPDALGAAGTGIVAIPSVQQTIQPSADVTGLSVKQSNTTNTADIFGVLDKSANKVMSMNSTGASTALRGSLSVAGGISLSVLATPALPTVTPTGTAGSTTYSYVIVGKQADGSHSQASAVGSTATGNATLTAGNYNALTWTALTGAVSYDVYRTVGGGTIGKLANATTNSYHDIGGAGDTTVAPNTNNTGQITARSGYSVNVKDFGAVGDGVAYDDVPIAAAIAQAFAVSGSIVYFPAGKYRIQNPINITNHANGGVIIQGSGKGDNAISNWGTTIVGDTGGTVFDCTGSQHLTFRDLEVVPGGTSPSTVGFNLATSTTSRYAQFDTLKNVGVYLNHTLTANSGHGTVGIYNYGAEIFTMDGVYVTSDQPAIFTGSNDYSITSTYVTTYASSTSMSVVTIGGGSTLTAFGGPCLRINAAFNIEMTGYMRDYTVTNTYNFAVDLSGQVNGLRLRLNVESFPQFIQYYDLQDGLEVDSIFNMTNTPTASLIVGVGSGAAVSQLNRPHIYVTEFNQGTHYLLDQSGANNGGVRGGDIWLAIGAGINNPNGIFSSVIHSVDVAPVLNILNQPYSGYVFNGGQGSAAIQGRFFSIPDSGIATLANLKFGDTTPTIAGGTGAGTSPTVTITGGHTNSGLLNITTGSGSPATAATLATITFVPALSVAPAACMIAPANAATSLLSSIATGKMPFVSATSTTNFVITTGGVALATAIPYKWWYHCF